MLHGSDQMKDAENILLWDKIQHFNFDDPDSVIKFADKLVRKNNWSEVFTKRVIDEYRKFIFLCCISPTGAAPSQTVDEAWHLHLIYTKSYWTDLCKNTLGIDLHHYPSKGGEDEDRKHEKWYKGTLALYEQVFGIVPPSDIWPCLKEATNEIEAPDFSPGIRQRRFAYILICLPFLFITAYYTNVFPAFLEGPQLPIFFTALVITIFISALIFYHFRAKKIKAFIQTRFPADVTVFQLATFLGEKDRAVQTGIVDLIIKGLLKVEEDKMFLVTNKDLLPVEKNPFVNQLLLIEEGTKVSYEEIDKNWYKVESFRHPVLERIKASIIRDTSPLDGLIVLFIVLVVAKGVQSRGTEESGTGFVLLLVIWCLILVILKLAYSRKHILLEEGEALYKEKLKVCGQRQDEVVENFAINGDDALVHLDGGILLGSIFRARSSAKLPESSCGGCGG